MWCHRKNMHNQSVSRSRCNRLQDSTRSLPRSCPPPPSSAVAANNATNASIPWEPARFRLQLFFYLVRRSSGFFLSFFNRKVLQIQPSRRVCGRNTCRDESHKKRCAHSSISSQLNPSSEREREKGWKKSCSRDLRKLERTAVHAGDVITGCLGGRTHGWRCRLLVGETVLW